MVVDDQSDLHMKTGDLTEAMKEEVLIKGVMIDPADVLLLQDAKSLLSRFVDLKINVFTNSISSLECDQLQSNWTRCDADFCCLMYIHDHGVDIRVLSLPFL